MLNLTGAQHQRECFELAAQYQATVVLCYVAGENVREITEVNLEDDPIPGLRDHFTERIEHAASRGVDRVVIDPGMGFYYGNLLDGDN